MNRQEHALEVTTDSDAVTVRARAHNVCQRVGMGNLDSVRFATAVSEVTRGGLEEAGQLTATFWVEAEPAMLFCRIEHRGAGVPAWQASDRSSGNALRGVASLVDRCEVTKDAHGQTTVLLGQELSEPTLELGGIERVRELPPDPVAALQQQQADLMAALQRARRSEDKLRDYARRLDLAIGTARLGVVELSSDDDKVTCNHQAAQLLGVPEGVSDAVILRETLSESASSLWGKFWDRSWRGEAEEVIEWDVNRCWLLAKLATIGTPEHEARVLVLSDISDRMSRERELAEQVDLEEKLMGIVSHDLKNPLSTLALALDAIEVQAASSQKRPLELGRRALERAERMIFDLLDFTRQRLTKRLPVSPQPTDLRILATQLIDAATIGACAKRIQLEVLGDTRGAWDPSRLEQVLSNLLDNALAYAPADAAIHVLLDGSHPEHVKLTFHNHGAPIPSEILPRLFHAFTRGTQSPKKDSLGLGMHIVRLIVEAHGGHVQASSDAETGTTVSAVIPRDPPAAPVG